MLDKKKQTEQKRERQIKKVLDSMKAFAGRAARWQNDTNVDFKMAYNHYFGKKG